MISVAGQLLARHTCTHHISSNTRSGRSVTLGLMVVVGVLCSGCAQLKQLNPIPERIFPRYHEPDTWPDTALVPIALDTTQRLAYPLPENGDTEPSGEQLYSFVINNMPVKEGLRAFARAYDLNIVADEDVTGILDVDFRDMTLQRALSFMLDSLDYYFEQKDGVIRVRSIETRHMTLDYLRLSRSGTGSSLAKVSSSSDESGAGGGGEGDEAGSIKIEQEDEIRFWSELEAQLSLLLSENGRLVINSLSGTVQVTDQHAYVEDVAAYIDHINRAIHRQVDIDVRIIEVALNDTSARGINWSRVASALDSGTNVDFSLGGPVTAPAGGIAPLSSVLQLNAFNLKNDGNIRLAAVLDALEEQGDVEIVSQPHVRTLNNQTSLIKVGTDRTFFRREQSTDSTSAGSITTATDIPQVVTEGVVLSITPQIGDKGWIMMDVSPVVTRVSSVSVVEGPGGQVQSSAPNVDVAQVSSLVRARSGDTIVLGGLIQTQDSKTRRTLPGLGRVPGLSKVFGGEYTNLQRKELIMVMTPTLVPAES